MDKEKLINEIMKDAAEDGEPITREEAEEMAEMEIKSKENRRYEQAEVKKPRKPKERKVDNVKKEILDLLSETLIGYGCLITSTKTETEISFNFNAADYTLKLTKHRPKK
jgi:hypothetical protein